MNEGQSSSRVGRGMKPREGKGVKPSKEPKSAIQPPTNEGQTESILEPVMNRVEGEQPPSNLEPEIAASEGQEFQTLDPEKEVTVAGEADTPVIIMPSPEQVLRDLYEASGNPSAQEVRQADVQAALAGIDTALKMALGENNLRLKGIHIPSSELPSIAELEAALHQGRRIDIKPSGETYIGPGVGLQPDGSFGIVVTIQEAYWGAVQEWAEADGVPPDRWLTDRLYEYISTYGEPAGKR